MEAGGGGGVITGSFEIKLLGIRLPPGFLSGSRNLEFVSVFLPLPPD